MTHVDLDPAVMDTEDAIQAWLDAHPDDHTARLVLADLLDERGDPRAAGYRAMGRLRMYPSVHPNFSVWGGKCHPSNRSSDEWSQAHRHLLLPSRWFRAMPFNRANEDWETPDRPIWKRHRTRRAAEDAAALAYRPEFEDVT